MEISQGHSCVATYISNKQKCHFFFFYRIRELEGRTDYTQMEDWSLLEREVAGKGNRVNTVQKLCTDICKSKSDICSNYFRNGTDGDKEEQCWG
jgi:hypothetical protein